MSRPLRILVAQNAPHTLRGGMSRMMGFIHDRVAADGHEVEFFAADRVPPRLAGRRGRFAFPWLVLRHLRRAALAGRPYDVVNIHEPSAAPVVRFKGLAGEPVVAVTTHGVEERGWAEVREDALRGRDALRWRTRLSVPVTTLWPSRYALRKADHVFCLNETDRQFLVRRYHHPPARVTRMFPAADPAYLEAFPRRDYAAPPARLLWFGTWIVRKGTIDAVAAFAALAPKFPDLTFTVMGAGLPAEVVLGSFPEALRGRVEYVPYAAGAGSPEYAARMLGAAVYTLPSVFEGTPLTLMETMATGLPVVVTGVCGMKDVVRDGENGLVVPPRSPDALAAALARVLSDRDLRERLGRRAHSDVAEHYTWDRVAEPVRAVYRRFADTRSDKA